MKTEKQVRTLVQERQRLIRNIEESLSQDLTPEKIQEHPAVLAQKYYVRALEWVLEEIHEL